MRISVLVMTALLSAPVLVDAGEPVWVFIEPPSAEAEREFNQAKEDAKADIAAGVLKVRVSGMWGPDAERDRLLAKLGMKPMEQGCMVDGSLYSRVYYEAIDKEIERRHGPDFWTRFDEELQAAKEKAGSSSPKSNTAADGKYMRAVADHVASFWRVPPDVPGGRRCTALMRFDAHLASAETEFMSCPDDRLQSSIAQAVQASLPLPPEIVALRTLKHVLVTFAVPPDEEQPGAPTSLRTRSARP